MSSKYLIWSYGVLTCPERRRTLLPKTLASLRDGGFDQPRLFVDGDRDVSSWESEFKLPVTIRTPPALRVAGNWILALYELYYREPTATRYALFQDDLMTYFHLRQYLEKFPFTEKVYLNLYTFPENQKLCARDPVTHAERVGWYPSNQMGRGAVALAFDRPGVQTLLSHPHMVERVQDADRGFRNVDGGIVTAMRKAGYREFVHNPTLTYHTGDSSSMGNRRFPPAMSYRGESFDALCLLEEQVPCGQ